MHRHPTCRNLSKKLRCDGPREEKGVIIRNSQFFPSPDPSSLHIPENLRRNSTEETGWFLELFRFRL